MGDEAVDFYAGKKIRDESNVEIGARDIVALVQDILLFLSLSSHILPLSP